MPAVDKANYEETSENSPDLSEDEEQEDVTQYRRGGYHPIQLGEILFSRYRIVRKIGWGHFSTVWLSRDLVDEKYVALKIVKSAPSYTDTAADEIRLLQVIGNADPFDGNRERVVKLLNHFIVLGPNGKCLQTHLNRQIRTLMVSNSPLFTLSFYLIHAILGRNSHMFSFRSTGMFFVQVNC